MHARAAELIERLALRPHPEGGFYRELFRSRQPVSPRDERGARTALTAIFYLLDAGSYSRWHQVSSDEVWHFYEGDALELLELTPAGDSLARHRLGAVGEPETRVCVIPAGHWQAARPLGDYALVGCTVAPGFEFDDFRVLADDASLAQRIRTAWPDIAHFI